MTEHDRKKVIELLSKKYTNTRFVYPEDVVEAWKVFVKQIVNGDYKGNQNEYWNDLDLRGLIEKIGYNEDSEVKRIDQEFQKTLVHNNVRNWGYDENRSDDWWNYGYPRSLKGGLRDEFEFDKRFKV